MTKNHILYLCAAALLLLVPASVQAQLIAHRGVLKNNYDFWVYYPTNVPTINPMPMEETSLGAIEEPGEIPLRYMTEPFEEILSVVAGGVEEIIPASKMTTYSRWKAPQVEETPDPYADLMPVVVFLHGSSLRGTDLNRVRRYGTLDAISRGREVPAIVIAPQNPSGPWNPDKLMRIIEWCEEKYPINPNRVYVAGISLGGFGTINFAGAYPDKIAAAIALCGGGNLSDYEKLNELPLWIIHGTADRVVPSRRSQMVVDAMNVPEDGGRLRFDLLQGVDHGKLARFFYREEMYDWLLSHSLRDEGRPVTRDYQLGKAELAAGYAGLHDKEPMNTVTYKEEADGKPGWEKYKDDYNDPVYYKVKKGDTLYGLAKRYHTSVNALCKMNGISEKSTLKIGQLLRVQ